MAAVQPDWTSPDGTIRLFCGDCIALLPLLDGIDSVVTDPPYGINYCHGARKGGVKYGTDGMSIIGDEKPFDPSPWLVWPCVLWGAEHYKERLPSGGRWLVWDKRRDGVVRDQACVENAWCSQPGVARIFRLVWDGADRERERNETRIHSNQKPVSLMEWCLDFVPGKSILDPYAGSATTAIACWRTGIAMDAGEIAIAAVKQIERHCGRPPQ